MSRGTRNVLVGLLLSAVVLYVFVRIVYREMGSGYEPYRSAQSAQEARELGTLAGLYAPLCASNTIAFQGSEAVYAAHPEWKRLGFLLLPKVERSPLVRLVVRLEDSQAGQWLEFEDGARAELDHEGLPTPERVADPYPDPDRTHCCSADRLKAPDRFWLVDRGGERLCTFTREDT